MSHKRKAPNRYAFFGDSYSGMKHQPTSKENEQGTRDSNRTYYDSICDPNNHLASTCTTYLQYWNLSKDCLHFQSAQEASTRLATGIATKGSGQINMTEESKMINRIFDEIRDADDAVTLPRVAAFFEQCPLYYQIYNFSAGKLIYYLRLCPKKYYNKLNRQEFSDLFFLASDQVFETKQCENTRVCVLEDESWTELYYVFDSLDTFGDQTVDVATLLHKLINCKTHRELLSRQAIYFPSIARVYTLYKVCYELVTKCVLSGMLSWSYFRMKIEGFQHIVYPSVDVIWQQKIEQAKLTSQSNTFMLRPYVVIILKSVFAKCTLSCGYFVKVSHFCDNLLSLYGNDDIMKEIVRTQPYILTLKQCLFNMKQVSFNYLDLDELLAYFSIKESESNIVVDILTYSSDEEEIITMTKKAHQYNVQMQPKNHFRFKKTDWTKPVEFRLSKCKTDTIRKKKVQQMFADIYLRYQEHFLKKFRANRIPISNSTEHFIKYQEDQKAIQEKLKMQRSAQRKQDKLIYDYLRTHTRLFYNKRPVYQAKYASNNSNFIPKIIPWFAQVELLNKIYYDKQNKKNQTLQQNIYKYDLFWKRLNHTVKSYANVQSYFELLDNIPQKPVKSKPESKIVAVPDFKKLHYLFLKQLMKAKKDFVSTKPIEFDLTPHRPLRYNTVLAKEKTPLSSKVQHSHSSPDNFIRTTLKQQAMLEHLLVKQMKESEQQLCEARAAASKQDYRRRFAKYMRKTLRMSSEKTLKKKNRANKVKLYKCYAKDLEAMYCRVLNRPFLFESKSIMGAKYGPSAVKIPAYDADFPHSETIIKSAKNLNSSF